MKRLIEDVEEEGLLSLMGKTITVYCSAYIYTGKLIGVNETCIKLADAKIVYDTGSHSSSDWANVESYPGDWYVLLNQIESFGVWK